MQAWGWGRLRSRRSKNLHVVTSGGTSMATVCSDHKGELATDFMYQGTTVNENSYFVALLLLRETIKNAVGYFRKAYCFCTTTIGRTEPTRLDYYCSPSGGKSSTSGVQRRPSTERVPSVFC